MVGVPTKVRLGAVQETAMIPLWARAVETKKARPPITPVAV
jgi:O-methyltransferase involved in polyketide biosynthesis